MPSTSKAQQQLMGMAYALKKGDMDPKDASQEVKDLADSMTLKQLKDFASTKHEGLPDRVAEAEDHEVGMAMSQLNAISKSVGELLQKIGREEKDLPGWIQDHISQSYNFIKQANDGYHELEEMVSPDSIGGMGATALPSPTSVGSGDIPKGSRDAKEEEEEEKKRRKEFLKKFKTFEEFLNEDTEDAIEVFAKDEQEDGFNAKIVLAKFDGTSINAQSTDKKWPDGTPVTKYFSRGGFKKYAIKGEYPVIDSSRGWWYYLIGRNWFAVNKNEYQTPPFEY